MFGLFEKKYNEIYDVLQKLQGLKDKPKFDENNYICKKINDIVTTLDLTCDEGKILKYILKILLKNINKINIKLINKENKSIDGEIFINIINHIIDNLNNELKKLKGSKTSNTSVQAQANGIVNAFFSGINKILEAAQQTAQTAQQTVKNVENVAVSVNKSVQNIAQAISGPVKKPSVKKPSVKAASVKAASVKAASVKAESVKKGGSKGAINVITYIISNLESIKDKINKLFEVNVQTKLDPDNNKYIPINDICINGKKLYYVSRDNDKITQIFKPEKCNDKDYNKLIQKSKTLFDKLDAL
jgi:hypothetical protein